ncbi:caspase-3-like [Epargyreus clarus]|uniref:caspase-3-like n=1 Tax=Epargyreus clarus TaxID=520877 RepID=UPI003C2FD521
MDNLPESFADVSPFATNSSQSSETQVNNGKDSVPKFNPNELYYDMSGEKYLLIFNHYTYKTTKYFRNKRPADRKGTEQDVVELKRVFMKMGYKVLVHNDLEYENIMKIIKTISIQNHNDTACLCIAILTHGDKNEELFAADMPYSLRDITVKLENGHEGLVGKPKLFFIQACRGDGLDAGRTVETDGGGRTMILPSSADFLFVRSSVEGYYSFRNTNGSFLIQELCKAIEDHYEDKDIHYITTAVNRNVAYEYSTYTLDSKTNNKKQMPEVRHTLTKLFMF